MSHFSFQILCRKNFKVIRKNLKIHFSQAIKLCKASFLMKFITFSLALDVEVKLMEVETETDYQSNGLLQLRDLFLHKSLLQ